MSFNTTNAVIYVQIPQDKWLQMESELVEIKNLLLNRTFPKKLTPYSIQGLADRLGVRRGTISNWIYKGTITTKRGIDSFEKIGREYVIMVEEDQLK